METVLEVFERISLWAAMPAVAGIGVALGLLLILQRWQVHALGMALLYFFVAVLHTRVIRPEVAVVKLLIGMMIAAALYLTGRYMTTREGEQAEEQPVGRRFVLAADTPFRILLFVAAVVLAVAGSARYPLPRVSAPVGLACYLLGVGGLFLMGLSEEPFRAGLGLLTFLAGFDLLFGALEPSLAVAGLLGASSFLVALAVTYLAVTHTAWWEEEA